MARPGILPQPDYRLGDSLVWDIDVAGKDSYAAMAIVDDPCVRVTIPDVNGTLKRLAMEPGTVVTLASATLHVQGDLWIPQVFRRYRSRRAARELSNTARAFLGEATAEDIDAMVGGQLATAVGWKSPDDGEGMFTAVTVGGLTLIPTAEDRPVALRTPVAAEAAAAGLCAAFHA